MADGDALACARTRSAPFDIAFSPDGEILAAGLVSGRVALLDPYTGGRVGSFAAHGESVRNVLWLGRRGGSGRCRQLLTGSGDCSLACWDVERAAGMGDAAGLGDESSQDDSEDDGSEDDGSEDDGEESDQDESDEEEAERAPKRAKGVGAVGSVRHQGQDVKKKLPVPLWRIGGAHDAPVSALAALELSVDGGGTFASGDDEGEIKVWDSRVCASSGSSSKPVHSFDAHEDFISDLTYVADKQMLLATSGDGTLSGYDLRRGKLEHRSDNQEDELLSVCVLKQGKKVVTGSTEGVLSIYSWGHLEDSTDRFPGHPESVAALRALDEDTLITASGDGVLRVVSVQPNKLLGVIGEHSKFSTERIDLHPGKRLLASACHDSVIKVREETVSALVWALAEASVRAVRARALARMGECGSRQSCAAAPLTRRTQCEFSHAPRVDLGCELPVRGTGGRGR